MTRIVSGPKTSSTVRMTRFVASGTAFVRSGLTDCRRIVACLRAAGFDPARGGDVLDFGAGCGRLLRHFAFFADACTFTALDVDREGCERADVVGDAGGEDAACALRQPPGNPGVCTIRCLVNSP